MMEYEVCDYCEEPARYIGYRTPIKSDDDLSKEMEVYYGYSCEEHKSKFIEVRSLS